ncbi:PAS domain S-box protein [Aeromonas hydrophila]
MDVHTAAAHSNTVTPASPQARLEAVDQLMARLELAPDGLILDANPRFLAIMGYQLAELKGQHYSMLLPAEAEESADEAARWQALRTGQAQEGEFHRLDRQGRDIWLRGSCSPQLDEQGALVQVIEYTMDLTEQKQLNANFEGQLNALSRVMGKVEFSLDGIILDANARFLETVGYQLEELKGQHHRLLVDPDYAQSADYRTFWETLRRGEYLAGEFCRIGKQGEEIWIQGSYNPVLDLTGKPSKIVKFATDITAQVEQHHQLKRAMEEAEEAARVREELHKSLQEMSTPVTPIWDGILLLPLVGIIDSMRTADVMNKSLTKIAETRAGFRAGHRRGRHRGYRRRQPADQDHQGNPVHGVRGHHLRRLAGHRPHHGGAGGLCRRHPYHCDPAGCLRDRPQAGRIHPLGEMHAAQQ